MRSRVAGEALALGWLLRTRDTRLTSTPASAATSRMVLRRRSVPDGTGAIVAALRAIGMTPGPNLAIAAGGPGIPIGVVLPETARGFDQLDTKAIGIDHIHRAPATIGADRRGHRRRDAVDAARF